MRRTAESVQRLLEELARERRRLLRSRGLFDEALSGLDELSVGVRAGGGVSSITELREDLAALRRDFAEGWSERLRCLGEAAEDLKQNLSRDAGLAALGELSASVAHEIRNPLCGILLSVEVLQTKMDPDDSRMVLLENLHREAEKMEKIVNNLLHFARHYEPRRLRCQLDDVVARSVESIKSHLKKKDIQVAIRRGALDCEAEVDPNLVQQVFNNILLNAVDACPAGSRLEVAVRAGQQPDSVAVVFRDHGEGIPAEMLGRIFDPFYTSKPNGIGLGLSVSKKIVEAHEGRLEAASELGEGTVFTVTFPRRADDQRTRVAA
ncbi:MAG: sensor histidine kinase [Planctomycetota bacterium]|jgi:signal transduction histidine kinase